MSSSKETDGINPVSVCNSETSISELSGFLLLYGLSPMPSGNT